METSLLTCFILFISISFLLGILVFIAFWKIFLKANQAGWKVLIPIYNLLIFLDIIGKSRWWFLLFLVPVVNIVIALIVKVELARCFNKTIGFGFGLAFLPMIFYPILGFGKSQYIPKTILENN
jgi:hypothetical protein